MPWLRKKTVQALKDETKALEHALRVTRSNLEIERRRYDAMESQLTFWRGMWRAFANKADLTGLFERLEALEHELAHDSRRLELVVVNELIGADSSDAGEAEQDEQSVT